MRKEQYANAVAEYENGQSVAQIAVRYGVTRQAMWDVLRRRGCVFRPQTRSGAANHFHRGTSAYDPAQNKVEKAIARGELVPQPCEVCGENGTMKDGRRKVQAHHDDYNKPLEVRWLCQRHHHEWHKHNTAIPASNA